MADTMTKLTRDQFIPFLDVDKDLTFASPEWKRIDYSTIFELSVGEQEEDRDYICFASAVTDVDSNKPELPQEIAIYEGNPMYDFIIGEFYNLPVGQDCKTGCLICPVHHHLLEFTQTHVHRVSDAIQPSHPLSSPSPPAPNPSQHQSLFQ